jgi:hypothetical protein
LQPIARGVDNVKEKMTNDKQPYGSIEESPIEPNDYASGYETGKAGENNDESKSLDWQRGGLIRTKLAEVAASSGYCICNQSCLRPPLQTQWAGYRSKASDTLACLTLSPVLQPIGVHENLGGVFRLLNS